MLQTASLLTSIQFTSLNSTARVLAQTYALDLWVTMDSDDATFESLIKKDLSYRSISYLSALMSQHTDLIRQLETHMENDTRRLVRQHAKILNESLNPIVSFRE